MKGLLLVTLTVVMLGFSTFASAQLIDNGGGLIYDTNLNITWYDYTYWGANSGGSTWDQATSWASGLNIAGVTGWRLPNALPINGSTYNNTWTTDGSTDWAYNISAPGTVYAGSKANEMAYLDFDELGNTSYRTINGDYASSWGLSNTGPFKNLVPYHYYWSGSTYTQDPSYGYLFDLAYGGQAPYPKTYGPNSGYYGVDGLALAVHDGDVGASVPDPPTLLLLASGLATFVVPIRRKPEK